VSGGVSDPALALFGPLRAGSLTPTCLVSVVLQEVAATSVEIGNRIRTEVRAEILVLSGPANVVMIARAHSVVDAPERRIVA